MRLGYACGGPRYRRPLRHGTRPRSIQRRRPRGYLVRRSGRSNDRVGGRRSMSQTNTVPSSPELYAVRPSGLATTFTTDVDCPDSVSRSCLEATSQTSTVPSDPALMSVVPFGAEAETRFTEPVWRLVICRSFPVRRSSRTTDPSSSPTAAVRPSGLMARTPPMSSIVLGSRPEPRFHRTVVPSEIELTSQRPPGTSAAMGALSLRSARESLASSPGLRSAYQEARSASADPSAPFLIATST